MFLSLTLFQGQCVSLALVSGSRCVSLADLFTLQKENRRAKGWAGPAAVSSCLSDSKNCHHVLLGKNAEEAAAERPGLRESRHTGPAVRNRGN